MANFLSNLIQEMCDILGVKKVNMSGYHPQTDGLVKKFNSTLTNMIAKSCELKDHDWDDCLLYLLFSYRVSAQESTRESPFFLLYGKDARVPTSTVLSYTRSPYAVDMDDFKEDLVAGLSQAWKLAAESINKSQASQKKQYDRHASPPTVKVRDRVMVYMPAEK